MQDELYVKPHLTCSAAALRGRGNINPSSVARDPDDQCINNKVTQFHRPTCI